MGNWDTGASRAVATTYAIGVSVTLEIAYMKARRKTFDAVAGSRKWKETVAKETEGMTIEETVAYFDRGAVRRRFDAALRRAEQTSEAKDETRE